MLLSVTAKRGGGRGDRLLLLWLVCLGNGWVLGALITDVLV